MTKEIHFYEDFNCVPDNHYLSVCLDWKSTRKAIKNNEPYIQTTQMCELSTTLIHKGYRIFVHQSDDVEYEITLKSKGGTGDHAVRDSQNIYAMWAANVFRIAQTVEDYAEAAADFGDLELKYDIDGLVYETIDDIPIDIKVKTVHFYEYDVLKVMAIMRTVEE